jgi:aconitate hydratase
MIAIGAGGLDVALAMAGEPFYLTCPKVIKIYLLGRLQPWVSAKDIILKVLDLFGTKGNVGYVFEYDGPGLETLTVPERATIANMGAECGVTTSVFPSDAMTRRFLKAQQREGDWIEIRADRDSEYDRVVEIDLSELIPLTAKPSSPGNISLIRECGPVKIRQVCLGSCTNSSYKDLATVAQILKGKVAHPDVSFIIAPGSKQVLENLARDGYLADLLSAGARLMENACGFCIGNSQSPPTGSASLRTYNRNFPGRSGTLDADVYIASPEAAAASIITGEMTDPRDLGLPYPEVSMPETFYVDDRMILKPRDAEAASAVFIYRGPNIGPPPTNDPLPIQLDGVVTLKVRDNITTDHIIPAGKRMKYRSNIPKYAEYLFEIVDNTFYERAMKIRESGRHNVIVAGLSYGQGSSREHAAFCPMYVGVNAVLARSFERIHAANLVNFGILPLTFLNEEDYERFIQGDEIHVPDIRNSLSGPGLLQIHNVNRNIVIEVSFQLTERQKQILLAGGALNRR